MSTSRVIAAASIGIALGFAFGRGTVQADPPGTTPNDESS